MRCALPSWATSFTCTSFHSHHSIKIVLAQFHCFILWMRSKRPSERQMEISRPRNIRGSNLRMWLTSTVQTFVHQSSHLLLMNLFWAPSVVIVL
jgi:hypothetical protein